MTKFQIAALIALSLSIAPVAQAADATISRKSVNVSQPTSQNLKDRVDAAARSVCTTDGAEGVRRIDATCKKAALAKATAELAARSKTESLAAR